MEQRSWYGFWHYGDVMHTYDADRHVWRYDVGGYAWDNAELGTDAALWYAFLRSSDPVAFRLAHAMTQLAVIHREVLLLNFVSGLSYEEIALMVGVPEGTVKSRLSNAKRALRPELEKYHDTVTDHNAA